MQLHNYDPETVRQILEEGDAVEAAIQESVREALLTHKRLGLPVVTWQDGKVVWIPADQISVDDTTPPVALGPPPRREPCDPRLRMRLPKASLRHSASANHGRFRAAKTIRIDGQAAIRLACCLAEIRVLAGH